MRAEEAPADPASLNALALLKLVRRDESGIALDSAILCLRRAAELSDAPAPVLADLAAALLVRAERNQAPRDLLEAYETAEQALKNAPRELAALYNRALALDRFGLVDETAKAWSAYLAADSTSGWAQEARRRRDTVLAVSTPVAPSANARLEAYTSYASADPQGARELGMDRLLGEWGEAVLAGDPAKAADRLTRAFALGDALERRLGGDASLADEVRAIRAAAGDRNTTRALARAHRDYAAGRRRADQADFPGAAPLFNSAVAVASPSPVLLAWARLSLATTNAWSGGYAENVFRNVAGALDVARYPALDGRRLWALGRTLGQDDKWEPALREDREAARLFAGCGERENEGAALSLLAEGHFVVGEADSAYVALHRSLVRLKPYRASLRLHNALWISADAAAKDGFLRSAVRLEGEGVGVAERTGVRHTFVEALLERARLHAAAGDLAKAHADLESARPVVPTLDPRARKWFEADLRQAEGIVSLRTDPEGATRALDSATASFRAIPFRALPIVVASAEARLAAGDAAGAVQRLERTIDVLEQRRASIRMEPRRAAVFDAARGVVDRIVLLKLTAGDTAAALDYMDRARASLAPTGRPDANGDAGVAALPGEAALEYARIADTVLIWTVTARGVEASRTVVDSARLARTIEAVEDSLEAGVGEAGARLGLSLLYEWLVRPIAARLDASTPLVIVADGEIAAVPFAALFDARRGRYLVENHALRFAVSLREARRQPPDGASGVLLVADPAFDRREHPVLERLAHARGEVRDIAGGYPSASLLQGADATRPAFEAALGRSGLIHFAGHAVFDDQRPERSYLLLASPAGATGADEITAGELARMDLGHVRLVVLSACRTVRSGRSRAGGFSGLSGALLAAGAGGTVGSTWNVDDASTAALMTAFHRAYSANRDGPHALRAAQLTLMGSPEAALRTPAAWAGFRYAGR